MDATFGADSYFVVMLPIARERRRNIITQKFLRAVQMGIQKEQISKFISQGADVNGKLRDGNPEFEGRTALHFQPYGGHKEPEIRLLLKLGADINAQDDSGRTPLIIAAELGSVSVAKILIENGADVNVKTKPTKDYTDSLVKRRTALSAAEARLPTKAAKTYGMIPQLRATIKILKAAGAKE